MTFSYSYSAGSENPSIACPKMSSSILRGCTTSHHQSFKFLMRFSLIPGRRRQGKDKRGYVRRLLLGRIPRTGPKSDEGDVLGELELAWMDLLE